MTKLNVLEELNPQQRAAAESQARVTKVEAGAGTGKTKMLIGRIQFLLDDNRERTVFVSYSTNAAAEIEHRLAPAIDDFNQKLIDVRTCHGMGNRLIYTHWRELGFSNRPKLVKDWELVDAYMDHCTSNGFAVREGNLLKSCLSAEAFALACNKPITDEFIHEFGGPIAGYKKKGRRGGKSKPGLKADQVMEELEKLQNFRRHANYILFQDMIAMPLELPEEAFRIFNVGHVLVDEVQDLNYAQHRFINRLQRDAFTLTMVGDECQPEDTPVTIPTSARKQTTIPIGDLKVGDHVVSYRTSDSTFVQSRRVNGITKRPYSGELVIITTSTGTESRYTPNHHCFATFEGLRDKHCLYLMRKGNQFRIGKSQMNYISRDPRCGSASGPVSRMRAEGADALWILDTYDTHGEAFLMEQAIGGKFGLPQLRFKDNCGSDVLDGVGLEKAWELIGENVDRAEECLASFGRDLKYPLVTSEDKYVSLKRPMVVRACNLLDGARVLPYLGTHANKHQWLPISIRREPYEGVVVSLDVEGEHLYVADGIVTHNCQSIFGFQGAQPEVFRNIQVLYPQAKIYKLETNYRCAQPILDLANEILKHELSSDIHLKPPVPNPGVGIQVFKNQTKAIVDWVQGHMEEQRREIAAWQPDLKAQQEAIANGEDPPGPPELDYSELAVLYRAHRHTPTLEMALANANIPYVLQARSFFEEPAVEDLLAYFQFVVERPFSTKYENAWIKLIRHKKYLGKKTAEEALEAAKMMGTDIFTFWRQNPKAPHACRSQSQKRLWKELIEDLTEVYTTASTQDWYALARLAYSIAEDSWEDRFSSDPWQLRETMGKANGFVDWVRTIHDEGKNPLDVLKEHQERSAKLKGTKAKEGVRLLTVHGAKGLEWDHVALWNVGPSTFPLFYGDPREERRLCYVGATRARRDLAIFVNHEAERVMVDYLTGESHPVSWGEHPILKYAGQDANEFLAAVRDWT